MNQLIKWIIVIVIIVVVAIIAISYFIFKSPSGPVSTEPIKIGAILSLTGYASSYGEYSQKAITLAVDEINGKGGIDRRNVEIIFEDDQTDAKNAVSAFQKLVNVNKVDGVIGSLWDFTTQPLLPLSVENKIVLITPTNFIIKNSFELNKNSFAMMPSFDKVIGSIEGYINNNNINKLGIVRFTSAFGQEIVDNLAEIMKKRGQNNIIDEKYNEIGGNDFRTTILKLKQQNIDAVFIDMFDSDILSFLQRARELKLNIKIITHVAILDLLNRHDVDKNLIENIVFINWEKQPKKFSTMFLEKYGIGPEKSADRSYDAIYVLADAIAKNKSAEDISAYIEQKEFETINGKIKFTDNHIVENLPVEIDVIKNGQFVPLEK